MTDNFIQCDYTDLGGSVAPAIELVDVKSYLKVTNTVDDAFILQLIKVALATFETFTGQTLIEKSFDIQCAGFPCSVLDNRFRATPACVAVCYFNCIELQTLPLIAVDAIQFFEDGILTLWPDTEYGVNFGSLTKFPFVFALKQWPITDCVPRPVVMTVRAGFGAASPDVPDDIKVGMMQQIAFLYENRGDCACDGSSVSSLPKATRLIYSKYIIYKLDNNWLC